jgi:hypothetical protein
LLRKLEQGTSLCLPKEKYPRDQAASLRDFIICVFSDTQRPGGAGPAGYPWHRHARAPFLFVPFTPHIPVLRPAGLLAQFEIRSRRICLWARKEKALIPPAKRADK